MDRIHRWSVIGDGEPFNLYAGIQQHAYRRVDLVASPQGTGRCWCGGGSSSVFNCSCELYHCPSMSEISPDIRDILARCEGCGYGHPDICPGWSTLLV